MSGRERKRKRKSSKMYLLHSKNSWNRKDDLPNISELEDIYYHNRDQVKVEEDDPFPTCSTSNQTGGEGSSVQSDVQEGSANIPFVCTFCDKGFNHKSTFQRHTRIHTGEKPFKCNVCDKTFSRKSNLKQHKLKHVGEKPCDARFCSRSLRNQHVEIYIHTNEKPYECNQCDMKFALVSTLTEHLRIHNGV
jgi:KRAB domain-containing zinc finger protein